MIDGIVGVCEDSWDFTLLLEDKGLYKLLFEETSVPTLCYEKDIFYPVNIVISDCIASVQATFCHPSLWKC